MCRYAARGRTCSSKGTFPCRGKGKGSLAQRAAPVSEARSQRGYSLLKRECPPRPPKEKRGGISISPRTPLKRHKGAGCGPPLWKPLPETRDGAGKTNPQGDEGRETRIKQKTDRVVHSEAERTRAEIRRFGFVPRYAPYLPAGAGICRFDIRV